MRIVDLLLRALFLGVLLFAAAGAMLFPARRVAPGLVFVVLSAFAHAAARVVGARGADKALLFLQALPFFCLAVVQLGKLDPAEAALVAMAGSAAGGAILAWEQLAVRDAPSFTSSVAFLAACGLSGLGLELLPASLFLGAALLALTVAGYGLARRARA